MAISKITLNGVTQMDVTGKTVTSNTMLDGVTSLKNDGTDITGNISSKTSSDLTVSGATVTAPAGNYALDASKSVASGSATAPASITGTSATVSTGTNTLTLTKTVSVTPSVTAGYVSSGTAGNSSVSLTANVNTRSSSDMENSVGSDNKLTVTAPAGYYSTNAAKTIQAASVTVGLNKGTASNHQITVSATKSLSSGYLNSTSQITTDSVSVSASELVSGTKSITSSGTTDVTNYASASVAAGAEGTPTAAKGTVAGNQIVVTPSVTNSAGYISGGTHTGTGVSVSASELVSGSETLSHNGLFDVTNLASIITGFPAKWEYETGYFTPSSDVVSYNISFSKTHFGLPFFACVIDVTNTYDATTYTAAYVTYFNFQQITSYPYRISSSTNSYGAVTARYRTTATDSITQTIHTIYYVESNTSTTSRSYPRYWVRPDGMTADSGSNSVYLRAGKKYKWLAVWVPELNVPVELGSMSGTDGSNLESNAIARTTEFIPVDPSIRVYLSNDANVALRCYDSNHTFVQETVSWLSSDFILTTEINKFADAANIAYVKFVEKYSNNRVITDLSALANSVEIRGIV